MSTHWDAVWTGRDPQQVSWFQSAPKLSLRLINAVAGSDLAIIDVGGGASQLVDHLLAAGHTDITVLDIAAPAISTARRRLGEDAGKVTWIVADATDTAFDRSFDIWHDRAVFHFLTEDHERDRYLASLRGALRIGGHLVIATFGPEGPESCSNLPVRRYSIEQLSDTLGGGFELIEHELEDHIAPGGSAQQFVYGLFRRLA